MTSQTARLILVLTMVLMASAAQAADFKNYPGATCQPETPANADIIQYGLTGEILNTSTEFSAAVVCPIVRDSVFTPPGDLLAVFVRFRFPSPSLGSAICTLDSRDPFGTSGFMDTRITNGNGNVSLTFPALSGVHLGYYSLFCFIPEASDADRPSALASYLIVEG